MKHRYTIVTLSEILAVTQAAEQGFLACAEQARGAALRRELECGSRRHNEASRELRELIGGLGGDSAMRGTIMVGTQRGWLGLRTALSLDNDEALVEQCEHGEDHALEVYRNALDDHLPEFVRQVIGRQFEELMVNHERMKSLRNQAPRGGAVVASVGEYVRQ